MFLYDPKFLNRKEFCYIVQNKIVRNNKNTYKEIKKKNAEWRDKNITPTIMKNLNS